ncbi:response regulator [Bosea eneae]|uniref:Response regulator n=1 Tax=Bosea eneae TaxID=151454 RepID=A0ABW0J1N8_9HYPH
MERPLVLVAEDQPLILLEVEEVLVGAGFEVETAADGQSAMSAIARHHSQLRGLVTDVRLGQGPNGWDVARHARELTPMVAVVYMTGDSDYEWVAYGVPNSQLIHKPFAHAQLITALTSLLNQAENTEG